MKLALVVVLVLCLALGESSLLKFSLRGLNSLAKRGPGGKEGGSVGGGREGGKEESSPGPGKEGEDEGHPELGQGGETEEEDEDNGEQSDPDDFMEQPLPCPTPEEFKAKLLEVIQGVKNYDAVIQGVASKAMDLVEGGDTTSFEDVAESYGSVLEESGKTFGALEFVGHFMTCAATGGTEFNRITCEKMIEFAKTQEYDPAQDEEYKRKMAEAFLEDMECFDAEYDLAAALGEEELAGDTGLTKQRAIGLLVNFIMELEAYGRNGMEFDQAVRTAYYKIRGVGQEPDKRGMQNERELRQLLMEILSRKSQNYLRQ